ncbi:MAG: YidC/Oxa1 family membrane protein insertase [Clostridia bacterium]|nr:YidC/Oxa1 family membrane protein insertase [Clostridia bacterium]
MNILMQGLGWILKLCDTLTGSYGLAIILFTVLIKLILLPLTVKQQRSMMMMQKLQPLLNEIQQKYANDKEKQSMETMKVYQKYHVNPMSGCLPLLIQLPILLSLYWVVKRPITYLMGVPEDEFWRIINALKEWSESNPDAIANLLSAVRVDSLDKLAESGYKMFKEMEIPIARFLETNGAIMQNHWITGSGNTYEVINFGFLGMDLSQTPSLGALTGFLFGSAQGLAFDTMLLWLIPILSGVSSYASMKISQSMQPQQAPQKNANGEEAPNPMKSMNLFMPFISAWFAFSLPAAVGLYWVASNLLQMVQQVVLNKVIHVDLTEEQVEGEIVNVKKNRKKRKK